MEGINGTSCSIFKLYETVIQGEEKETIPKWIGIENIKDRLTQTLNTISTIRVESNNLQASNLALSSSVNDFIEKMNSDSETNEENKNDQTSLIYLTDPTDDTKKVLPEYYNKFSPIDENGTYLFDINSTDFYPKIYENYLITSGVAELAKTIAGDETLESTLTDSTQSLDDIQVTFTDLSDDILDEWKKYQDYLNKYANLIFYLLTGLMVALGIVGFICTFFYSAFDKCQCMRIPLHVIWNIFSLFTFILMLLGSLFGLLGVVGSDGVGVMQYAFGPENLDPNNDDPIILKGGEAFDYINTCLNGDGNLASQLGLSKDGSGAESLDQLYKMDAKVNEAATKIEGYGDTFASITNLQDTINKMRADISLTNSVIISAFTTLKNTANTVLSADNSLSDKWVDSSSECGGLAIIKASEIASENPSAGTNACFILSDYFTSENKLPENRYKENSINTLLAELKNYQTNNKDLLETLSSTTTDYKTELSGMLNNVKNDIQSSKNIIEPLTKIYKNDIGDDSIYSIVNCAFMKTNINVFFDQMDNGLSNNATKFAITIIFVSLCSGFSNLFILIVINRFKKTTKDKPIINPISKDEKESISQSKEHINGENPVDVSQVHIEMTNIPPPA